MRYCYFALAFLGTVCGAFVTQPLFLIFTMFFGVMTGSFLVFCTLESGQKTGLGVSVLHMLGCSLFYGGSVALGTWMGDAALTTSHVLIFGSFLVFTVMGFVWNSFKAYSTYER